MKGVVLAGGTATRLYPLTTVTNKHLLPVYDRPMIYYPLQLLADLGIRDVLIVTGGQSVGDMVELLGDGALFGLDLTYRYQAEPLGIAQAVALTEPWTGGDRFVVVLGDNIMFRDDAFQQAVDVMDHSARPMEAACVLKRVANPSAYGVAMFSGHDVVGFVEKPADPPSEMVPIGFYVFGPEAYDLIRNLTPSDRGEYEITDLLTRYARLGRLRVFRHEGYWGDAGTVDGLRAASEEARSRGLAPPSQ